MYPQMHNQRLPASWLFLLAPFSMIFLSFAFFLLGCLVRGDPVPHLRAIGVADVRAFSLFVYGIGNALLLLVLHTLLKRRHILWSTVGFRKCSVLKAIGYAAAATVAAFLLYPVVEFALGRLGLPMYWNPEQSSPVAHLQFQGVLFVFFGAVVTAPLGEDTVFRGYLLSMLKPRIGVVTAVLVSSLIFAALHVPFFGPGLAVYILPWSVISCLLFIKLRSLYPCFLFHAANNLIAYIVLPLLMR